MTPSKYQQAIYDAIENGSENLIIEAVAGSGKTTTIVEAVRRVPWQTSVLCVAFNRHIKEELATRFKTQMNVEVVTLNGFGWRVCMKQWPGVKLEQFKTKKLLMGSPVKWHGAMSRVIALLKSAGTPPESVTDAQMQGLADYHDLELPQGMEPKFFLDTLEAYKRSCEWTAMMDFDDQIAMPIIYDLTVPKYDLVVVDEAQDLSPAQAELVRRAARRLIAVGDTRQAIYGFRGAGTGAMAFLRDSARMRSLPLSICYRCPPEHVALARAIVPQIEAAPGRELNPMAIGYKKVSSLTSFAQTGDYILCRTTAPLVEQCMKMIAAGRKATVKGRDIGMSLKSFVQKREQSSTEAIEPFLVRAAAWVEGEYSRLEALERPIAIQQLEDKWETIAILATGCKTVGDLLFRIETIFSDDAVGIIFCTVHRAKGLEADCVFLLKPELMPFPKAKRAWQIEQEMNLKYVALTRSRRELIFLTEDK